MLKFSAGYVGTNPNFVIQNIDVKTKNNNPVFAIFNNILLRGCPTIPSKFLQKNCGGGWGITTRFNYVYDFENVCWNNIIKGGVGTNPAIVFYNEILPKVLGKYAKTFIAECPLSDIIYKYGNVDFESVDFYSPLFNAVIEIDGNQHINNDEQNIKDHNRNKVLELNGVDIIRIKTSEINNFNIVKQKLNKLKYNLNYKNSVVFSNNLNECDLYYMSIMRIEILLLSLYQYNYLKLTDNQITLNIYSKENIKKEIFETAYFDFMSWLKNLSVLQNQKFVIPNLHINIVNSEKELSILKNGINIAIFLKDVYSQTNYSNIIYIKNDYFLYEENLIPTIENNSTKSSYRYKKNYFKISNCNITYKITKEGHSESLILYLKMFLIFIMILEQIN